VSDERDKQLFTARPPPNAEGADVYSASTVAMQAPADLLDLVRSAEEEATIASGEGPSSATKFHGAAAAAAAADPPVSEEVVDVGDEAVDAPPSTPTLPPVAAPRAPVAAAADLARGTIDATPPPDSVTRRAVPPGAREPALTPTIPAPAETTAHAPPAIGILIFLAVAIGALALLTR
jgi:hypothetical protein